VRDYVLVGEVRGPSSAYSQLAAQGFLPAANKDSSFTDLSWSGPLPVAFQGAYVAAVMPSLIAVETQNQPAGGFDFGWTPVSLRKFHSAEELAIADDYQVNSGAVASEGLLGWRWSSDNKPGIYSASGVGSSVSKQASIQRTTLIVGIVIGLAASAVFTALQLAIVALTEWKCEPLVRSQDPPARSQTG
jgi:hypothetical protein